jgi:hypothetical protein
MLLLFGAALSVSAALEFYCDFENRRSGGIPAVAPAEAVCNRNGPEDGSALVAETPEALTARSKKSLELTGGFLFVRDAFLPAMTGAFAVNFFFQPQDGGPAVQALLFQPGGWALEYHPARRVLSFVPANAAKAAIFPLPPDFADSWRMITLNVDERQVELYLDGEWAAAKKIETPAGRGKNLMIGAASTKAGKATFGRFDDFTIWSGRLEKTDAAKLYQGASPQVAGRADLLKRTPTRPYEPGGFRPLALAGDIDVRQAVIVPLDHDGGKLARFVQAELEKSWKIKLPIRPVAHRSDGTEPLILAGAGMGNALMRELAANGQILRTSNGPEVHVYPEAMDWKRGVVYAGGRNEAEVRESIRLLTARFPSPERLSFFTAEKGAFAKDPADPAAVVGEVKSLYAGKFAQQNNLTIKTHMKQLADDFRRTGDDRYVNAFAEVLDMMFDHYDEGLKSSRGKAPTFEAHSLPTYLYLFEQSPRLGAESHYRAAELIRKIIEGSMDCWEMAAPATAYAAGTEKYWTNHYCFAARTVYASSRYLQSRAPIDGLDYFMAVADFVFQGVAPHPLSPEDAGGYQYLVYRIYTDYMLANGRATPELFQTPAFLELMEYAKSSLNHLGYTAGYGDAILLGMRGPFVPLFEYLEMTGDPEAEALLSIICRHVKSGFYADSCRAWGIDPALPPPSSPRFIGLRTFTVSPARQELLGIGPWKHPPLDKAVFRTSWQPDAVFLAVNGLNGSPHGHDDAIGVSQYLAGSHLWLYEGDYIRRAFEDHNLVSVIRDGYSAERRRNKIPRPERAAQLLGTGRSEDRKLAAMTLLLERNNGVNYYRHFGLESDRGLWVIDELVAEIPGDYRFSSRWRTTGAVADAPQGVIVRQKEDKKQPDDKNVFSISEGTGSVRFSLTDYERGNGNEPEGSLAGYAYSDWRTKTQLFWKDVKLDKGERVYFAFYFRPQSEKNAQPVAVRQVAENVFAADGRIAIVDVNSRATFRFPGGTVFTGAGPAAEPEVEPGETGRLNPNRPPAVAVASALPAEKALTLKASVSRVGSGERHSGIGLSDGGFLLLSPAGRIAAEAQLPAEVTAVSSIRHDGREYWAVGCRDTAATDGQGWIHLLDSDGKILWSRMLPRYVKRKGVPRTVFPAGLDGKDAEPLIIVGVEAWHVYAFTLDGRVRWESTVTHGAVSGAAGDLDGDGKDEVYPGVEYYYHTILGSDGKERARTTTSPLVSAALVADAGNGEKRVFAARSDGFLYGESIEKMPLYQANIGGPAVVLVPVETGIAAANVNGFVTVTDAAGKRRLTVKLPAPVSSMLAGNRLLLVAALDGRVYGIDPASGAIAAAQAYRYDADSDVRPMLVKAGAEAFVASGSEVYKVGIR